MIRASWLTFRTGLGSYLTGGAVAAFAITLGEVTLTGTSWGLLTTIPLFLLSGWLITPRISEDCDRDRFSKVANWTLFAFYWSCLALMVIQFDKVTNVPVSALPLLHQFYFFSTIAGGFGTIFHCTFLEQRMRGEKFSFDSAPKIAPHN